MPVGDTRGRQFHAASTPRQHREPLVPTSQETELGAVDAQCVECIGSGRAWGEVSVLVVAAQSMGALSCQRIIRALDNPCIWDDQLCRRSDAPA
jgi:hypothetical protein